MLTNCNNIITKGNNKWWIISAFLLGASLHFESASGFFYLFVYLLFLIWRLVDYLSLKNPSKEERIKSILKRNLKLILISFFSFFITLVPQIVFNFRHGNILVDNFLKLFTHEKAFSKPITMSILETRIGYFWSAFMGKVYLGWNKYSVVYASLSLASLIVFKNRFKKGTFILFAIFL